MKPPHNTFAQGLRAGRTQIGLWLSLADPYAAEICAGAGFDWLLIDGEHAPNDVRTTLAQLQAIAPYPAHAVVRPPVGSAHLIKQYLDIGAQTLLMPMVESAAQARDLVAAMHYPPRGIRGVGNARASRFGAIPQYYATASDHLCLLVQIESQAGLAAIDEIAATDGVDGIFIGPSDLAASLGHLGNPAHPEVQAAIDHALDRTLAAGRAPGILTPDETLARRCLDRGALFVAVGIDVGLLVRETRALAARFVQEPAVAPAR